MLDIGWPELMVVAVVLIVVVGPKDLPPMLRAFGRTTKKIRGMANEFRGQFNDALKEADLDEVRQAVDGAKNFSPNNIINKVVDPLKGGAQEISDELNKFDSKVKAEPVKPIITEKSDKLAAAQPATAAKKAASTARKPAAKRKPAAATKTAVKTATKPKAATASKAKATSPAKPKTASTRKPAAKTNKSAAKTDKTT